MPGLGQQIVDLLGVVLHVVEHEGEARRVPQAERVPDPGAQHALGAFQRGLGGRLLGHVAEDRVEDAGLAEVAGDPGVGDGDHAEPGVLDLTYQRSHQFPYALRMPTRLGWVRHIAHLRL
jgi:hypothetical protein